MSKVLNYLDSIYLTKFVNIIRSSDKFNYSGDEFCKCLNSIVMLSNRFNIPTDDLKILSSYLLKYKDDNNNIVLENKDEFKADLTKFINKIKYLLDIKVDKNDNSLNKEFKLILYDRYLGKDFEIKLRKSELGWDFYNFDKKKWEECNAFCEPHLFAILNAHLINYPNDLKGYLKWLWLASTVYNFTLDEMELEFNELEKWINLCNNSTPKTKIGEYK